MVAKLVMSPGFGAIDFCGRVLTSVAVKSISPVVCPTPSISIFWMGVSLRMNHRNH